MPLFSKPLLVLATFTLIAGFSPVVEDAHAQSNACIRLNNQLASLNNGSARSSSGSRKYRQYSDAIRKQQIEISKTSKVAKRNRCTSRGLFRNTSSQCKRIVHSLNKMEANLQKLKQTREKYAPRSATNSRKRRSILAKMERFGCNTANSTVRASGENTPRKSRRRSLIEQIFGIRTYRDRDGHSDFEEEKPYSGSTYRTLCVRKTDGYYFPISFSTTRDFFERDEQTCINMCPGVNVGLYHHLMPSEDSESMVAYGTEFPYANEKFAFLYRKSVDYSSQCRFALKEDRIANNAGSGNRKSLDNLSYIGTPVFRIDRAYSPDDHDVIANGITLAGMKQALEDASRPKQDLTIARELSDKKIRIVGPAFFPVQ